MAELYPGIAFSPQAALAANIGAADTVIRVSDASVFPNAPNLATIGTDEDGETILYTAKADGLLSGCQRGVEGIARAWNAGEIIGRNFTAHDYNSLIRAVGDAQQAADTAQSVADSAADAISSKQDALSPDETITLTEVGRIGVALPSKALTRAEYDALPDTEKMKDVAYLVPEDEPVAPASGINQNLLDNWYLAAPVNQRGNTEYTGAIQYTIDRWLMIPPEGASAAVALTNQGISFPNATAGLPIAFDQRILLDERFQGRTATGSILLANGTLGTFTKTFSIDDWTEHVVADGYRATATYISTSESTFSFNFVFRIIAADANASPIAAVKLELGRVATLAHIENGVWMLADLPSDPEIELRKCKSYFRTFNAWTKFSADYIDSDRILFSVPGDMRADPAVGGNWGIYHGMTEQEGFTFSAHRTGNNLVLIATKPNHGLDHAWLGVKSGLAFLDANL